MISGQTMRRKQVAPFTAYRYLKSIGKNRLPRNVKPKKKENKRFEWKHPNDVWQVDNMGPFYKSGKFYAYNIVDDHSRYSLAVVLSDNQRADSWVTCLEVLFQQYGTPKRILHDNGLQFIAPSTRQITNDLGKLFDSYKVKSMRSSYKHPETCGKVERFQQSLEYEARDIVFTNSMQELQEVFDIWRDFYNIARAHFSTEMVPYERYYGKPPDPKLVQKVCIAYEKVLDKYHEAPVIIQQLAESTAS